MMDELTTTQHPYDGIDLVFLLLSAMVPQLAPVALLQYAVRRSRLVVGGVLQLAAQVRGEAVSQRLLQRPVVRALLPGVAMMSDVEANTRTTTIRLNELADADNILVVGPKGSGKTTLLASLLQQREGSHCALDPHNQPGKWPCAVVGGGLDFPAIDTYLQAVNTQLTGRYRALNRGAAPSSRLTLVADEWRAIAHALPDRRRDGHLTPGAARIMLQLITQGRKVGLCFVGAGHADTVEALGIAGEGDLRTCFDWIIYLGALAVRKLPEARTQPRPAVAYHTERDIYTLLTLPTAHAPLVREHDGGGGVVREQPVRSTYAHAGGVREQGDGLLAQLLDGAFANDVLNGANGANGRSAHDDAMHDGDERSRTPPFAPENVPTERANANAADGFVELPPSVEEFRQLAHAVTLRTQGCSKQESIEAAFGVRKGGGSRWQRAYALFTTATSG